MTFVPPEIAEWLHRVSRLSEKHAGLGGWVGAIGAVIAIFVTWWLARAEYLRTRRHDAARLRAQIDRIATIVTDFEAKVAQFVELYRTDGLEASAFYPANLNDPEFQSMSDLAHLSVNNWPSLDSYAEFKRYWNATIRLFESARITNVNRHEMYNDWKQKHDASLPKLRTALKCAGPN
jgi:hypothetical protein